MTHSLSKSRDACRIAVRAAVAVAVTCVTSTAALAADPHKLAEKNGCLGCHAAATKLVGPAYREVAAKYAGQPDALAQISQSIVKGSAGKWGELEMPPHPNLSKDDVKVLATWILAGAK